jgi:hypothetical protein
MVTGIGVICGRCRRALDAERCAIDEFSAEFG